MRSRLVIPAALLVAAAYVKGRQDAFLFAPAPPSPATPPSPEAMRRAEAEAADAHEIDLAAAEAAGTIAPPAPPAGDQIDLSVVAEWLVAPSPAGVTPRRADDEPAVLSEWSAVPAAPLRAPAPAPEDPALLNEWLSQTPSRFDAPLAPMAPAAVAEIAESGRFALGGWAAEPGHMAVCGVIFRTRREGPVEPSRIRLVIEAAQNVAGEGLVVLADAGFAPDREGFTLVLAAGGPGAFAASGRYVVVP